MILTHGVIGNTSDFGSEESRFETWWVNKFYPSRQAGPFGYTYLLNPSIWIIRGNRFIFDSHSALFYLYPIKSHP
jgi:hypothetical protein